MNFLQSFEGTNKNVFFFQTYLSLISGRVWTHRKIFFKKQSDKRKSNKKRAQTW